MRRALKYSTVQLVSVSQLLVNISEAIRPVFSNKARTSCLDENAIYTQTRAPFSTPSLGRRSIWWKNNNPGPDDGHMWRRGAPGRREGRHELCMMRLSRASLFDCFIITYRPRSLTKIYWKLNPWNEGSRSTVRRVVPSASHCTCFDLNLIAHTGHISGRVAGIPRRLRGDVVKCHKAFAKTPTKQPVIV